MARDAKFLFEFIADFWDLFPKEDKDLLAAYWYGLIQIVADLYQEAFEVALASTVKDVTPFRTERWNRYQLNTDTASIETRTDSISLAGTTPVKFYVEERLKNSAILFDTIKVTNTSRSIYFLENISFVDEEIYNLTYNYLVPYTVRVYSGSKIYVEGKDYNLNTEHGIINRIGTGDIPIGIAVSVAYMHAIYKELVDYIIDKNNRTIARTSGSAIPDGAAVSVLYDYDKTTPDNLCGKCNVDASARTIKDEYHDFTGVSPGRTVTILTGANAGSYTVLSIISSTTLKVVEAFVSDEDQVSYTINAFPYAITISDNVRHVPTMQDTIIDPTIVLRENVDYLIGDKKISFRSPLPVTRSEHRRTLSSLFTTPFTSDTNCGTLWAEETQVDLKVVYRNFGILIDFYRESSADYLNAVRGLWRTYWMGPTHENLLRGMHILLGLPYATEKGTVKDIAYSEVFRLDVSPYAELTSSISRSLPQHASDSIVSATKTITFQATTGSDCFTASDIGKKIRILASSVGNNGYYTISSIVSAVAIQVAEDIPSDEIVGFRGEVYEASPINVFSYLDPTFSHDDIGRIIRVSGSAYGDGDYEITSMASPHSVKVTPDFPEREGPGGFTAELYIKIPATITVEDEDGILYTYTVPAGLDCIVNMGDTVGQFQRLTSGVRIYDKINTENFVELHLGRRGIQRFLTQNASKGSGDSDETRALVLLEEHLWLAQILADSVSESTNSKEEITFLRNMKPRWSEFIFSFAVDFQETMEIGETLRPDDIKLTLDLTSILRTSWFNIAGIYQGSFRGDVNLVFYVQRSPTTNIDIQYPLSFSADDALFTEYDVGRYIQISNSANGNNGRRKISKVLSATQVIVETDFVADETAGGVAASVVSLNQVQSDVATFTTTANPGDILVVAQTANVGIYGIAEILDDTHLLVSETSFDGSFVEQGSYTDASIIPISWFMEEDSVDLIEDFLFEGSDGIATNPSSFSVSSTANLYEMGVQTGYLLVIKSGTNQGVYPIASITNRTTLSVTGTLVNEASQNYAVCLAAIQRSSGATIQEVLPI